MVCKSRWKYKTDNGMKWQGLYDDDTKTIKINKKRSKKKSTVIDSIVHEMTHKAHPKMHEKTVYKETPKKVKRMSLSQKHKLYSKFS